MTHATPCADPDCVHCRIARDEEPRDKEETRPTEEAPAPIPNVSRR